MPFHIKIFKNVSELYEIRKDWGKLAERADSPSIALTPDWFISWWNAHSGNDGWQLQVIALFEDKILTAVFPFYWSISRYRGLPVRKLSLLVDGISPHGDFVIEGDRREKAIDLLLSYLSGHQELWNIVVLDKFRDSDNRKCLLQLLSSYNFKYGIEPSLRTPIIQASEPWDVFWSGHSVKFKKSMRNKLNRVKNNGTISVERVHDAEALNRALPTIFEVSRRSWKGKIKEDIKNRDAECRFYKAFTEIGARRGWVDIWLLKVQDQAIAYEYHLTYNSSTYPLRADFDESYRHLSPGSILEYKIIKQMFEKGEYDTYYSCANDYQYLRNWTNTYEQLLKIEIFSNRLLSKIAHRIEYTFIPQLRKIRLVRKVKELLMQGKRL